MAGLSLTVRRESWPILGAFTISRGSRRQAEVVVVELDDGSRRGWAECAPYPRYGETVAGVIAEIEAERPAIEAGIGRDALRDRMAPGAARNAVDCALWDLEAKRTQRPAFEIAGLPAPAPMVTAFTISLAAPEEMAAAAAAAADRPLLKLKLGGPGDVERVAAVRAAAPESRLIVDANEAWQPAMLADHLPAMAEFGVELVEQPLPADADAALATIDHSVPICADESFHDGATLASLAARYDFVNVKLDKTGGLTEALRVARDARAQGLGIMVGCMVATSLAMAPAVLLGGLADLVDLDGPLLLARDRTPALAYVGSVIHPPEPELWG